MRSSSSGGNRRPMKWPSDRIWRDLCWIWIKARLSALCLGMIRPSRECWGRSDWQPVRRQSWHTACARGSVVVMAAGVLSAQCDG
jgi:hypothetical protein